MATAKRPISGQSSSANSQGSGPVSKRPRTTDDDNFPTSFEDELAFLQSVEEEENSLTPDSGGHVSLTPPSQRRRRWQRPPPPAIDPTADVVTFQQIDIDHYIGRAIAGMPGAQSGPVPILRMFGVTSAGNSICAHVHGFLPYFYVPAPSDSFRDEHCVVFRDRLNQVVLRDMRSNKEGFTQAVLAVEICRKCSIYGYHFNKYFPFLRVTMASPKLIAPARRLLSSVKVEPFGAVDYQSYESNIEYEIRFMVDTGVVGCNWIECPPGTYNLRRPRPHLSTNGAVGACPTPMGFSAIGGGRGEGQFPTTQCQIELDISWEEIVSHPPEGEWQKIAPLRILSFDIECAGRKGYFPEAERLVVWRTSS